MIDCLAYACRLQPIPCIQSGMLGSQAPFNATTKCAVLYYYGMNEIGFNKKSQVQWRKIIKIHCNKLKKKTKKKNGFCNYSKPAFAMQFKQSIIFILQITSPI